MSTPSHFTRPTSVSTRNWLTITTASPAMPSANSTRLWIRGRNAIITAPTTISGSTRNADVHSGVIFRPSGVSEPSPK